MLWLSRIRMRLRTLFRQDQVEEDLSHELAFHLAEQKAEYLKAGMSDADAGAAARRAFGQVAALEEECRDHRQTRWLEDFLQDVKFALRSFSKAPTFTAVAVLTLALGIGANTAFFSAAYGILFRPLPYPEPERLVDLNSGISGVGPVTALRDLAHEADYAGYLGGNHFNFQLPGGQASRVQVTTATWNLGRVLGVSPARGRWFELREESPSAQRVTVLSDRLWRERFGSDPAILGRRIHLNEKEFEVVGVMPAGFTFPSAETELWIPVTNDPGNVGAAWGSGNSIAIGRLRSGATRETARVELKPAIDRVRRMFPWKMPDLWGSSADPIPYDQALSKEVRPKLLALSIAALLLLLIACANVGNLLLGRAVRREREFTMREALGARVGRLARQLLTENLVLVLMGGVAGCIVAAFILQALPTLMPADTPRLAEIAPDLTLYSAAAMSMLATVVLFSVAPLFRLWRLRRDSLMCKAVTASRRMSGLSLGLIGVELALSTTLLIGAALMGRTLWQLGQVDSGIHTAGLVSAGVSAGQSNCATTTQCQVFLAEIGRTLRAEAGVRNVAWSNVIPLGRQFSAVASEIQDHLKPPTDPAFVIWQTQVTPQYFKSLGVRLLSGRLLSEADVRGAMKVMLISESTAKRFWPNESSLGKRMRPMSDKDWLTIVGVVSDVSQFALTGFPQWVDGSGYVPLAQAMPVGGVQLTVFVESAQPLVTLSSLAATVRRHFPDVVVSQVKSLEQVRSESVTDQRSTAWLLALMAGLGLVLGVAGVYGVISHRASQRKREIGIRMALGASAARVVGMVLRETLAVSLVGALAGVAAAYGLSRFLSSLLFGITTHDTVAFAVCPLLLLLAALVAAAIPALRASRTDAAMTLRDE